MALGQLAVVWPQDQGDVCELRGIPAQRRVSDEVLGSGGKPFNRPDHLGDPHQVVIDDLSQVVCGEAVGLEKHLVVDRVVLKQLGTEDQVIPTGLAFWYPQPNDRWLTQLESGRHLFGA